MNKLQERWLKLSAGALVVIALAAFAWQRFGLNTQDNGIVSGNGRIEGVEIDVAARTAGRLKDIRVGEGDFVTAGQVVALMDTQSLEAQKQQAEAQLRQAQDGVTTARSQLAQRKSEKTAALAIVAQRETEVDRGRGHQRAAPVGL